MPDNFWGNPSVEPKRAYRWLLSIPGLDGAEWIVKKINKPSFSVTETEHNFINHKFYYPGRVEWNTVSLTIVDPVTPVLAVPPSAAITTSSIALPIAAAAALA